MIVIKPNKLSLISIKRLIRWFEPFGFGLMEALVYSNFSVRQRGLKEVGALGDKSSNLYQRIFLSLLRELGAGIALSRVSMSKIL